MKNSLEDLSPAARRGELSPADGLELERLLDDAPDERLWHRAGLRFDAEDQPLPGDDARVQRLIERTLARRALALTPRRKRPVALFVAAAALMASAAAAMIGVARFEQARERPLGTMPAPSASSSSGPHGPQLEVTSQPQPEPSVSPAPSGAALLAPTGPAPAPVPRDDTLATAPELLSAAGQARRKGESARAVKLLEALQTRFPSSAEAQASDITLGMLRLKSGAAAAALRDFDRSLRRSPNGARAADALWGRSQALRALGRSEEAGVELKQLLSRYPASPHTSAARAQLRDLSP